MNTSPLFNFLDKLTIMRRQQRLCETYEKILLLLQDVLELNHFFIFNTEMKNKSYFVRSKGET